MSHFILYESDSKMSNTSEDQQIEFPKVVLEKEQKTWLKHVYEAFMDGRKITRRLLLHNLREELPEGFDPEGIPEVLLLYESRLTLLGALHVDPQTPLADYCNRIGFYLRDRARSEKEIGKVSLEEFTEGTGLDDREVSNALILLRDFGFPGGGGSPPDEESWIIYNHVSINEEKFHRRLFEFKGVEAELKTFYEAKYEAKTKSWRQEGSNAALFSSEDQEPPEGSLDLWGCLHSTIEDVSRPLFESEHYAQAVEAAYKQVEAIVKEKVADEIDEGIFGRDLMFQAFKEEDPLLQIPADLNTVTNRNIQEGYKFLFAGAFQGIRNPKAHNNLSIQKDTAIHMLFLASQLINVAERAD